MRLLSSVGNLSCCLVGVFSWDFCWGFSFPKSVSITHLIITYISLLQAQYTMSVSSVSGNSCMNLCLTVVEQLLYATGAILHALGTWFPHPMIDHTQQRRVRTEMELNKAELATLQEVICIFRVVLCTSCDIGIRLLLKILLSTIDNTGMPFPSKMITVVFSLLNCPIT